MKKAAIALLTLAAAIAQAQGGAAKATRARKVAVAEKPSCAAGAICFSGEVSGDDRFVHAIDDSLDFVLEPGWTITITPRHEICGDFANVLNPPYRAHRALYINVTYGWKAEEEVSVSPREFDFVTNCADYRTESDRLNIVLWPYTVSQQKANEAMAKLGTSPAGKGRLWITGSRISHAGDTPDNQLGKIEWMKFSVEVRLPKH